MTIRLTPQMVIALRSGEFPVAPLIEIDMPGYTLRHIVGGGELMWGDRRFLSYDPRFGTLTDAGPIQDGIADEAPEWSLSFAPPSSVAVSVLTAADVQGSPLRAWLAAVNRATGQVVPDPIQLFEGELDAANLTVGKGSRTIEWRAVSALERFHDTERGARLSDAWHQTVWPGETGCANMSGIEKTSYWGVEKVPGGVTYGTGGGGGSSYLQRAE